VKLTSGAFAAGAPIPAEHTCRGADTSPPLAWTDVPVGTRSLALVVEDPDAPGGTWVHWVLFNLPADAVELAPAMPRVPELPSGARQGLNDAGNLGYMGPCPPPGPAHRYFFHLYALACTLNLDPGVNCSDLDHSTAGQILAQADLMGTFQR
jgi:Raf kinase inhibitor-like YbhB/YbcL family protein